MPSEDDLEDLPDWARDAVKEAKHEGLVQTLNEALRVMALCQRKLRINQLRSTLDARHGVTVGVMGDASGENNARYATVNWNSQRLTVFGTISEPRDK